MNVHAFLEYNPKLVVYYDLLIIYPHLDTEPA